MDVLSYPFAPADIKKFGRAGIYLFSELTVETLKNQLSRARAGRVPFERLGVLYVGKAKSLHHRLCAYGSRRCADGGEEHKRAQLRRHARSVMVIEAGSHFEACALEIFLIRMLKPDLNYTSVHSKKIVYLRRRNDALIVQAARPRAEELVGFFTSRRDLSDTLQLLFAVLMAIKTRGPLLPLRVKSFSRRADLRLGALRTAISDPVTGRDRALSDDLDHLLRGKKSFIHGVLWARMREASEAQQYRNAAAYRDVYFAICRFQQQIRLSRRILRTLKNAEFSVDALDGVTRFDVRGFDVSASFEGLGRVGFAAYADPGGENGSDELTQKSARARLTSSLGINYEILRLMLLWHIRQTEPCRIVPLRRNMHAADAGIPKWE